MAKRTLLLALDRHTHEIPWEAVGSFGHVQILRSFGHGEGKEREGVRCISSVLNPGGDLTRTEHQLLPLLNSIGPEKMIVGRAPGREEMREVLRDADLVLYFGHGSGELYLPASEIGSLERCGSVFLFGCSSGRLRSAGKYGLEGALLAFRDAGSRVMLANLWDVTDRDIDKLTESFLRTAGIVDAERPFELSQEDCISALETSRGACLLRYLNGAAPVIYINDH